MCDVLSYQSNVCRDACMKAELNDSVYSLMNIKKLSDDVQVTKLTELNIH